MKQLKNIKTRTAMYFIGLFVRVCEKISVN